MTVDQMWWLVGYMWIAGLLPMWFYLDSALENRKISNWKKFTIVVGWPTAMFFTLLMFLFLLMVRVFDKKPIGR